MDLLGTRCSFQDFKRSLFVICDCWISIRFYFKFPCLWASCFGQLLTCLRWFFWSFLIWIVFLSLTCKSASFLLPSTKILLRFPSLLSSQELSSVFALAEPCGQNCHNITSSKKLLHSCFLLPIRIIFCFSLLTLRSSRALSILNSAESAIIFPKSLPSAPLGKLRRMV